MKTIIFLMLLFSFNISTVHSQSGWFVLKPFPNANENINDIYFTNNQTGFLVTDEYPYIGRIYKTSNQGTNWTYNFTDLTGGFTKLYFLNSLTGFALGSKLYKTTNSGATWISKRNGSLNSICFVDSLIGYGCGRGDEFRAEICVTTNGGESWQNIYHDLNGSYIDLYDIHFFNSQVGLVTGEHSRLAKTTNGGSNWNYVLHPDIGIFRDMEFINDNVGFVCGKLDSVILKTTNQGDNWFPTLLQKGSYNHVNSINFINESTGFGAFQYNNVIIKTINSGNNWFELPVRPPFGNGRKVYFLDELTGYLVGGNANFFKTTNGGNDWETFIKGDTIKSVFVTKDGVGYCGGYNGKIMKTTNSGINWFKLNSETSNTINDLTFLDIYNGIYIGRNGVIGTTTNSGVNWVTYTLNPNVSLNSLYFYNNGYGLIAGGNGKIFKTTNSGIDWTEKNSGSSLNLNSIFISSLTNAYSVGDSGIVLRTTDSGETWLVDYTVPRIKLNSISILDNETGYIAGNSGKLFRTTNNGLNWQIHFVNNNLFRDHNQVYFANSTTGYLLGNSSTLYKSTNQGLTWGSQGLQSCNPYKIFMLSTDTGYIVGSDGYIFKTIDGGGTVVSVNENNLIPYKYYLSQNYPNPFNPITKIKFEIPSLSNVKLTVFDILGKEIETLINKNLQQGVYESEWDGSKFPSGIYFYSLNTNSFTETKRMILLK
ncbi:MAG: YCF48-related protein [Ignavibacteria bacterium]